MSLLFLDVIFPHKLGSVINPTLYLIIIRDTKQVSSKFLVKEERRKAERQDFTLTFLLSVFFKGHSLIYFTYNISLDCLSRCYQRAMVKHTIYQKRGVKKVIIAAPAISE